MEGTPPMSSYEDETGVKLIIIIIIIKEGRVFGLTRHHLLFSVEINWYLIDW